jgi:hypothetical protein
LSVPDRILDVAAVGVDAAHDGRLIQVDATLEAKDGPFQVFMPAVRALACIHGHSPSFTRLMVSFYSE